MSFETRPVRPVLSAHARFRWDELRRQHQIVFPEGVLVLNETGAAIVRLCDGRPIGDVIAALETEFPEENPAADVHAFVERLARKGLLSDASADS